MRQDRAGRVGQNIARIVQPRKQQQVRSAGLQAVRQRRIPQCVGADRQLTTGQARLRRRVVLVRSSSSVPEYCVTGAIRSVAPSGLPVTVTGASVVAPAGCAWAQEYESEPTDRRASENLFMKKDR